jgi:3-hydroxyisobutyrate dehydrogenase
MTKTAFLGLGIMGAGMAARLLAAGFEVALWNRSADKAEPLRALGGHVAATPAEAARGAQIVVSMLADDTVSRQVWTGPEGALPAMAPGAVAVESSTLTGPWVRELAGLASARGVAFVEAPVTGSRDQAAQGTLRFLLGGEASAIATARPALDAMGSATVHLGPAGSAATVKLANNFLCGVQAAALAEALALLEKSGLDIEQVFPILAEGAPGSPLVKAVGRRMLERAYTPHFLVPLMAKDLAYAQGALDGVGVTSTIAQAARQRFIAAQEAGSGALDIAAIMETFRSGQSA